MNIEIIESLIEILPNIFIYIVPGYIILRIISYRFSRNSIKDDYLLLKSIVISYVLIVIVGFLVQVFGVIVNMFIDKSILEINLNIETLMGKMTILLLSIIFGFIWCKFITSDISYKILGKLGISKSLNTNIFDDIVDKDRGLWMLVYLRDERIIYFGAFQRYEEREDVENYFLVLSNYRSFGYDGMELEDQRQNPLRWVMINTKDISRIELIYDEESKKVEKSKKIVMMMKDKEIVEEPNL